MAWHNLALGSCLRRSTVAYAYYPAINIASDRASTTSGNPAAAARSVARRVGADIVTSSGQSASTAFSTNS